MNQSENHQDPSLYQNQSSSAEDTSIEEFQRNPAIQDFHQLMTENEEKTKDWLAAQTKELTTKHFILNVVVTEPLGSRDYSSKWRLESKNSKRSGLIQISKFGVKETK